MTDKRLLCLGYGYVSRRFAACMRDAGWQIAGTVRGAEQAAALEREGVSPVLWASSGIDEKAVASADAIVVSTPPLGDGCPAFAAIESAIGANAKALHWIGYLSSNGVYGDHNGEWVDELSPLRARSARAKNRIRAEAQWAGLASAFNLPLVIFRLPGVYGPGRSALDAAREGRAKRIIKPGQVFNRAHVDDIAAVLKASVENPDAGTLFNIADDEPAPPQGVVTYACELLGVEPPPATPIDEADLSEMARSFYEDNKRVSNAAMKEELGVSLQHPTYRDGLRAIFESGQG